MSKTSKLCQVVYHSTCRDGTKVFKLLCGSSGSKDNYTNKTNVPYEKVFVIYSEKLIMPFFTCYFPKFYASYKKTNDIFAILVKF